MVVGRDTADKLDKLAVFIRVADFLQSATRFLWETEFISISIAIY